MKTALNVEEANCAMWFNEALEDIGRIDGVWAVYGSIGESCIHRRVANGSHR